MESREAQDWGKAQALGRGVNFDFRDERSVGKASRTQAGGSLTKQE